jgi:hypothetical protein
MRRKPGAGDQMRHAQTFLDHVAPFAEQPSLDAVIVVQDLPRASRITATIFARPAGAAQEVALTEIHAFLGRLLVI